MTAALEIRMFGGLEIRLAGEPVGAFVSSKAPALLAYLGLTQRPCQRDLLAALLWGEMGDADAKNNLRQALTSLRKPLDPYLDITRDTVALRTDMPIQVDVRTFLAVLRRSGNAEIAAAQLQTAADLYRGEFLEGFLVRDAPEFEDWVLAQRTRLRELALQAMHSLTAQYIAEGAYARAIDVATHLVAVDTWREESHRLLMLALARTGQLSAALAQYQRCQTLMREVFGAEPAADTTALYGRIRAALSSPRHNLPATLTGFVGREAEMEIIHRKLTDPACRLLTIVGPGGAGKSRLAVEAAARYQLSFLNGVWLVAMGAISSGEAEALPSALAAALNIPAGAGDLRKQVVSFLHQRELLIVLDNMEHLLDDVGWLTELLVNAPDVKILATSRERLNLQSEQVLPLDGLPLPAETGDPADSAAVALFLRRAQHVEPGFVLMPDTAEAVAQICRAVGGLPLGIELAAAWAYHLTCAEIASAIAANLDFLTTSRRDISPRQRSLRAVFDHSWRLLRDTEQQAFVRLAVFRGGFTRSAASAVAAVPPSTLAALVEKSLVRKSAGDRYDLHEVLRQFAAEQWQTVAVAEGEVRRRHSRFYLDLLARQVDRFKGPDQRAALATVGEEIENVRGAWLAAVAEGWFEHLAPAVEPLYHFYMLRSWLAEGLETFRSARLTLDQDPGRTAAQQQLTAHLALREAKFLLTMSRFEEARALLLAALPVLHALDAPGELATTRYYLGQVCASTGAYAVAEEHVQASLATRRTLGDRWGQAVSLLELGGIAFYQGHHGVALEYCTEGLQLAEGSGDLQTIAHLLTALSIIYRQLGDLVSARHHAERGLAVYEQLDSPYGRVQGLLTLGGLAVAQRDWRRVQSCCEQALILSVNLGLRSGEADSHYRLGQAAAALGEVAVAAQHLRQALHLAAAAEEAPLMLDALCAATQLLSDQPTPDAAHLRNWLLDRSELDAQRRQELSALLLPAGAAPPLKMLEIVALAIQALDALLSAPAVRVEDFRHASSTDYDKSTREKPA